MKKFLMSISLVLLAFTVTACGCEKKDPKPDGSDETTNKPVTNTNEDVIKDQTVGGLSFTNTSLVYDNNISMLVFVTQVENTSNANVELGIFCLVAKDEEGKEIARYASYAGETLEPGVVRQIMTKSDGNSEDVTKIKKIDYLLENNCKQENK